MCRVPFEGRWPKALKHFFVTWFEIGFHLGPTLFSNSSYFHCCCNLTSQEVLGYLQLLTDTAISL